MERPLRSLERGGFGAILALALCLGAPGAAGALSIGFSPSGPTVPQGASVVADVIVSSPGGMRVGAYDLLVSFDAAVLGFAGVDFGAGLGGPLGSIQDVTPGASDVGIVEVSLLASPPQDGTSGFALFTLRFDALAVGVSALEIVPGSAPASDFLADDLGIAIVPDAVGSGRVEVVAVPEPLPLVPLGWLVGFVCLAARKRATGGAS